MQECKFERRESCKSKKTRKKTHNMTRIVEHHKSTHKMTTQVETHSTIPIKMGNRFSTKNEHHGARRRSVGTRAAEGKQQAGRRQEQDERGSLIQRRQPPGRVGAVSPQQQLVPASEPTVASCSYHMAGSFGQHWRINIALLHIVHCASQPACMRIRERER